MFPLLPSPSLEVRFLCVELLRLLFSLPEASSQALREQLLGREEQQEVASLASLPRPRPRPCRRRPG